jgi:hypothetical protein
MRMATAGEIQLTVLGSKEAVSIGPGSVVDLDRVIGETAGVPLTLGDALGPHIQHFEIAPRAAQRQTAARGADVRE